MTEPKKRGRPAKVVTKVAEEVGRLTVKKAGVLHDGKGGFLPVGFKFHPVDEKTGAELVKRGLAE